MIPLLHFIVFLIGLYMNVVIAAVIVSWLIAFGIINRHNEIVYMIARALNALTEPALRPIREVLPDMGGLDISPIVLWLLLYFVESVVIYGWLMPMFR
jgi:YggT family protein